VKTSRRAALLLAGAAALPLAAAFRPAALPAQEQAPNRPDITIVARNFRFVPDRVEVMEDDLVRLTIQSEDNAYSFVIDEYRIIRRVAAGRATSIEFRADRTGTFRFYSNLTNDGGHKTMQGQLVVRGR
jgi:heme/copper-type cytochrome/quinol oxidase subunit 2